MWGRMATDNTVQIITIECLLLSTHWVSITMVNPFACVDSTSQQFLLLFLFYGWGNGSTEGSNNLLEMTELMAELGFESKWAGTAVLDKQGASLSPGSDNPFIFCSFHLLPRPFIASNVFCLHPFVRKVPWLFKVNHFYDVIIPVSTVSLPSVLNSYETLLFSLSWLLL